MARFGLKWGKFYLIECQFG